MEISKPHIYLSVYRGFLQIYQKKEFLGKVPLDDILGLVITGHGCSHSSHVLTTLTDRNIPVSICGSNFIPKILILPIVGNCRQSMRMRSQFCIKKPLKKRLWKQIVQLKLKNQAAVLKEYGLPYEGLFRMSSLVKAGDPDNLEAQGARRYWTALFTKNFKREIEGTGVNAMLNYGYAVVRSCVARGVVAAGLHPSIGIHHKNIYNPLCLVDDLMEPFRPIADYVVKQLSDEGFYEVDKEVKATLAKLAVTEMLFGSESSPLFHIASRISSSLAMVFTKERQKWDIDLKINWKNFDLNCAHQDVEKIPSSA